MSVEEEETGLPSLACFSNCPSLKFQTSPSRTDSLVARNSTIEGPLEAHNGDSKIYCARVYKSHTVSLLGNVFLSFVICH